MISYRDAEDQFDNFLSQFILKIDMTMLGDSPAHKRGSYVYITYIKSIGMCKIQYVWESRQLIFSIYISLVRTLYQMNLIYYKLPGTWEIQNKARLSGENALRLNYIKTSYVPVPVPVGRSLLYDSLRDYDANFVNILDYCSAEKVIEYVCNEFNIVPIIIPSRKIFNAASVLMTRRDDET